MEHSASTKAATWIHHAVTPWQRLSLGVLAQAVGRLPSVVSCQCTVCTWLSSSMLTLCLVSRASALLSQWRSLSGTPATIT